MIDLARQLSLDELPHPPLYRLVDEEGREVFQETEIGGEPATVGVLFAGPELAREFAAEALEHGMAALSGLELWELGDWRTMEVFASAGEDYVLVVSRGGIGLFHAGDVALRAAERAGEIPLPLYLLSDERGEAPVPPLWPLRWTYPAPALTTPAAIVPTPRPATSLTPIRAIGFIARRSAMSWARSSIE